MKQSNEAAKNSHQKDHTDAPKVKNEKHTLKKITIMQPYNEIYPEAVASFLEEVELTWEVFSEMELQDALDIAIPFFNAHDVNITGQTGEDILQVGFHRYQNQISGR